MGHGKRGRRSEAIAGKRTSVRRGKPRGEDAGAGRLGLAIILGCLAAPPAVAGELSGTAGSDGSGHNGTVGDAGGQGGAALDVTAAGTAFDNGQGGTAAGGAGGDGRSLTGADAQSLQSQTLGIDGTAFLAGQAGIAAGNSFDVRVNGVTTTVSILAGETLSDVAAKVEALAGVSASATATGTNDTLTISQDSSAIEEIRLFNNFDTPLTDLGLSPLTISPLFSDGGDGGDGGVAITLSAGSSGLVTNDGTLSGGAGGAGGSTLARAGDGGDGGDGAVAVELRSGSSIVVHNRGTIRGGAGGDGGSGGLGGTDGAAGQGAAGVLLAGDGATLINGGLIAGGLDGNGSGRAAAVQMTGDRNRLELQPGARFQGDVVATGSGNALLLGGAGEGDFDNAALGVSLRGFESFGKTGTGTWRLTGNDGQRWHVSQGILVVDGSIGAATVTGGQLGGSGSLGSLTLGDGRLAPGNSVGTLAVEGDVEFGSGSVYEVEVDADGADRLEVGGTAELAGSVEVVSLEADGDRRVLGDYTILSAAGGLSGRFAEVEANYAFLLPALSYRDDRVVLTLAAREQTLQALLAPYARSGNARRFVASLEEIDTGASGYGAFENALLLLPGGQETAAVEGLSGSAVAATDGALERVAGSFLDSIRMRFPAARATAQRDIDLDGTTRAAQAPPVQVAALDPVAAPLGQADRAVTWGRVVGSRSELEDSGDLPGVESRLAGFHLGAEAPLGGGFLFGVALGFERGTLDAGSLASSDLDAYSAGLYARQRWAAFRLSAGASYTHLSLDGSRSVTGFGAQTADYAAGVWGAEAEAAYDLAVSRTTTLTPLAGVRLARSSRDGYAESGIAGLEVADSSQESLRGRLGAELTLDLEDVTLFTRAAWSRELADPDASAEASLLGGPSFTIEGQRLPDDVAEIGASLAWSPRTDLALFATYDGAFSGGYASHAGGIGIRFAW